jgi:hypothetical protein
LSVSVIREPYLHVNDFISFDAFLRKNKISSLPGLKGDKINEEIIAKYIEQYSELFRKYGIALIESDKQFPGYFPQWT